MQPNTPLTLLMFGLSLIHPVPHSNMYCTVCKRPCCCSAYCIQFLLLYLIIMTMIMESLQMSKYKDKYSLFIDKYVQLSKGDRAKMFDHLLLCKCYFLSVFVKTELTVTNNRALF